jgi:hypothetical protein
MKNMQSTSPRKKDEAKVISGLELYRASRGPVPHSSGCGAWRRGPRKRGEQSRKAIREQI